MELTAFLLLLNAGFIFAEFPYVSRTLLGKFSSFDKELGWCPQPGSEKVKFDLIMPQKLKGDMSYSFDQDGGRTCHCDPGVEHLISTYGDSFCFCREVSDEDTWQNILAKKLGIQVSNFGGGNYGLDQSLLRLKRNYPRHPTPIVVIAVTPYTFERILSVWRHYSEPGNVLAVKPRFKLVEGRLTLIENIITDKNQFMSLRTRKGSFRSLDENYAYFKANYGFKKSNLADLILSPGKMSYIFQVLIGKKKGDNYHTKLKQQYLASLASRKDVRELFAKLVEDFHSDARQMGFTPVFMMLPDMANISYMQENGSYYQDMLDSLRKSLPSLLMIDFYQHLEGRKDLNTLFVGSKWHYSPKGNKLLTEVLEAVLETPIKQLKRKELSCTAIQ